MNSATPALLAALLALSLVAIPVAAGPGDVAQVQPQVEQQDRTTSDSAAEETPNRLSLEGEIRSEYAVYGSDLGTLLASTDDELRIDYTKYIVVDSEFEDASPAEREEMVQNAYERIEQRADELEQREQDAVKAHAAGDLTTGELLQTVLRNHREAAVLSDAFSDLEAKANRISDYSLSVGDEKNKLEMHRTPVRSALESAAEGQRNDVIIAIKTSETGYALAVHDGSYIREATRFDNRASPSWPSEFDDASDAYEHTSELYPWVFENRRSAETREDQSVNLYRIYAAHNQGRFEAYLDGGTGGVHREVQVLNPTSLPTETETVWSNGNLELSLNETPADGPAEVTVTDVETGDPETATVTVDGFEVGETDDDGTLWFAPPAGEYELTIETNAGSMQVTVSDG